MPASVSVRAISQTAVLDYPFTLGPIALPAHDQMPEALVPPTFSGHEAPVTVSFVKIAGDPDFPQVWLREANHADKDIQGIGMTLTYLDCGGNVLKTSLLRHDGSVNLDLGRIE